MLQDDKDEIQLIGDSFSANNGSALISVLATTGSGGGTNGGDNGFVVIGGASGSQPSLAPLVISPSISPSGTASGAYLPNLVSGTAGNDVLHATAAYDPVLGTDIGAVMNAGHGDDTLFGSSLSDTMSGGDCNDILLGGAGSDFYFGGRGDDAAVFDGERADYDVRWDAGGRLVVEQLVTGEIDYLTDIEQLRFDDVDEAPLIMADLATIEIVDDFSGGTGRLVHEETLPLHEPDRFVEQTQGAAGIGPENPSDTSGIPFDPDAIPGGPEILPIDPIVEFVLCDPIIEIIINDDSGPRVLGGATTGNSSFVDYEDGTREYFHFPLGPSGPIGEGGLFGALPELGDVLNMSADAEAAVEEVLGIDLGTSSSMVDAPVQSSGDDGKGPEYIALQGSFQTAPFDGGASLLQVVTIPTDDVC